MIPKSKKQIRSRKPSKTKAPKGVASSRLVMRLIGRVDIDRALMVTADDMPQYIQSMLTAGGFPLDLMGESKRWEDKLWRWQRFRDAATKVGATEWCIIEDNATRTIRFEWWGPHNDQTVPTEEGGEKL